MVRYRAPRRGGFTLIELLTVIAILAILSALVTAGIARVRSAQQTRNTEATLTKLQQALDAQRNAILDQCRQDRQRGNIPQPVLTFCGNDKDMAEAVWALANLKRELPETFNEALGDVCPNSDQFQGINAFAGQADQRPGVWLWFNQSNPTAAPTKADRAFLLLSPRATFNKFPHGSTTSSPPEAAALLYQILTEKGNKGVAFAADEATAGAQTLFTIPVPSNASFQARVFTDVWGTPIWFSRLADFPELQAQPFVSSTRITNRANSPTTVGMDPIDPLNKLFVLSAAQKQDIHLMAAPPGFPTGLINGDNKLSSVFSAGPDKTPQVTSGNTAADDVIGYRLHRQGASGG